MHTIGITPTESLSLLPKASFGLRVLSLPASVCLCVRVSVCVYQSRAGPHDYSPLVQARITKFEVKVPKTLVKIPVVLRVDRPWPSRSNVTWNLIVPHFELVRKITCHSFKLESPNLDQKCILVRLRFLVFWGLIDLDLQGQIWLKSQNLSHFELVCMITCHPFKPKSPNLDQKWSLVQLRTLLITGFINLHFQFHF